MVFFNGPLAGATNNSLTLSNLSFASMGDYQVIITNYFGSVTSSAANLTVNVRAVAKIAAGFYHSLYLRGDGSLWGMGANDSGQLGIVTASTKTKSINIEKNQCLNGGGGGN